MNIMKILGKYHSNFTTKRNTIIYMCCTHGRKYRNDVNMNHLPPDLHMT